MTISTLYEDDDVWAVLKPEGMATIPDRAGAGDDLITLFSQKTGQRLWVVHRLDKPVSGVLLLAKHSDSHRFLSLKFQNRQMEKGYTALVHGCVTEPQGVVEAPIRTYGSGRMGVDAVRGKASVTRYELLASEDAFSLITAIPRTGRRHQIRVHLYHLGHPLVGDPLYGDRTRQAAFPRLMLHAQRIAWTNPAGHAVEVTAPWPESFHNVLTQIGLTPRDS